MAKPLQQPPDRKRNALGAGGIDPEGVPLPQAAERAPQREGEPMTVESIKVQVETMLKNLQADAAGIERAKDDLDALSDRYKNELRPEEQQALDRIIFDAQGQIAIAEKKYTLFLEESVAQPTEHVVDVGEEAARVVQQEPVMTEAEIAETFADLVKPEHRIEAHAVNVESPAVVTTGGDEGVVDVADEDVVEETPAPTPAVEAGARKHEEEKVWEDEIPARPVVPPPAARPRARQAKASSARELLNIARIEHARLKDEERARELEYVRYADTRAILDDPELVSAMVAAMQLRGRGHIIREGEFPVAAVEDIAQRVGLSRKEARDAMASANAAMEDRIRRDVLADERGTLKEAVKRGARGAAVSAALRWAGLGLVASLPRIAEVWARGRATERKVQERIAAFTEAIRSTDPSVSEEPLRELMEHTAARVAFRKQQRIDDLVREREISDVEYPDLLPGVAVDYRNSTRNYLKSSTDLSLAEIEQLANATARLYAISIRSAVMERRTVIPEKLLDVARKVFPRPETYKGHLLRAGVFAVAGCVAKETPIVGGLLLAFSGAQAGKAAGVYMTERFGKERYRELRELTADEQSALQSETVDPGLLNRARLKLLDAGFRRGHPADYQIMREAVERHTAEFLLRANAAEGGVQAKTKEMIDGLQALRGKQRERAWITNAAGIAGAAVFGAAALALKYEFFSGGGGASAEEAASARVGVVAPAGEIAFAPPAVGTITTEGTIVGGDVVHVPEAVVPATGAGEAPAELVPEISRTNAEAIGLAQIHQGEGATQVFMRQLEKNPTTFGYPGDPEDAAEVKSWALKESKRLAIEQGYLAPDGRTTILELKFKEGTGLRLQREGENTVVNPIGDVEKYAVPARPPESIVERTWGEAEEEHARQNEEFLNVSEPAGPKSAEDQEFDETLAYVSAPPEQPPASASNNWIEWEEPTTTPAVEDASSGSSDVVRELDTSAATESTVNERLQRVQEGTSERWKGVLKPDTGYAGNRFMTLGKTGERIPVLDVLKLETMSMRDLLTKKDIPDTLKGAMKAIVAKMVEKHPEWASSPVGGEFMITGGGGGVGVNMDIDLGELFSRADSNKIIEGIGDEAGGTVLAYLTKHPEIVQ